MARGYAGVPMPLELLDDKAADRFEGHIKIGADDECWPWLLSGVDGYGQFCMRRPGYKKYYPYRAHRVAYTLWVGDIPPGMLVCHTCDNKACCNPNHLFLGTHADNSKDRDEKGRAKPGHVPGEKNGRSKLTSEDVMTIRAERAKSIPTPFKVLAGRYPASEQAIKMAAYRITWKHI